MKIVFIGHTTEAYETDEDSFFKRGSSGGTQISSAPKLAREIALDRYHPSSWNIYAFHCSDGDNFETDNENAFEEFKKLCDMSQMVGYCEIKPPEFQPAWSQGGLGPLAKKLSALSPKMRISLIETKNDIWSSFKKFFGNELK